MYCVVAHIIKSQKYSHGPFTRPPSYLIATNWNSHGWCFLSAIDKMTRARASPSSSACARIKSPNACNGGRASWAAMEHEALVTTVSQSGRHWRVAITRKGTRFDKRTYGQSEHLLEVFLVSRGFWTRPNGSPSLRASLAFGPLACRARNIAYGRN